MATHSIKRARIYCRTRLFPIGICRYPYSTDRTNDDIVFFDWYKDGNIYIGSGEYLNAQHIFPPG